MDQSRRAFLTATTGVAVASAGCLSRITPWGGGGDESGSGDGSDSATEDTNAEQEDEPSGTEGGAESNTSKVENESDEDSENESESEQGSDQQPEAEDDSTKPNATEADVDNGDLKSESESITHENSIEIRGVIENNTGDAIDQVTIDVVLVDDQNNVIFRQRDGTLGLAEWSTWEFSVTAEGQEYVENAAGYDIRVTAETH